MPQFIITLFSQCFRCSSPLILPDQLAVHLSCDSLPSCIIPFIPSDSYKYYTIYYYIS
ncbi:hypothetical protein CLOSCI_03341 [[Clostridium] scindens ATCC 35704]|nr:hypothetical protein CLOSCI_03341 [[Clostridium] scindens ATCC 35704]